MSYNDFAKNKHTKIGFQKYLGNSNEPWDNSIDDSPKIPNNESRMDIHRMRRDFRRIAQKLRDEY